LVAEAGYRKRYRKEQVTVIVHASLPGTEAHLVPVITVPSGASQLLVSESPAVIVALKYK
jgi:hypothetical protein